MSLRKMLLILVACALGLGVIPLESLNCPAWDVWVVDQNGQPVSGIAVRLSYKNYSAEDETHEIDRTTDQRGHTAFAAQTLSASLVRRLIFILSSLRAGIHASFGRHASVFAFGKGLEGFDVDLQRNIVVEWTGESRNMESRIV